MYQCDKLFEMEILQTLHVFKNVLGANHAVEAFTEGIWRILRWFYVKKLYENRYSCMSGYDLTMVRSYLYNETVNIYLGEEQQNLFSKLYYSCLFRQEVFLQKKKYP